MPNHKIAPFPDRIQSRARPCFLAPFPKSPCPSSDLQAPLHPPAEIPKVSYGVWSPWAITPSSAATGVFLMVLAGWRRPVLTCCPAGAPVSPHQLQKCSWQPLGEATGALAPRGALDCLLWQIFWCPVSCPCPPPDFSSRAPFHVGSE